MTPSTEAGRAGLAALRADPGRAVVALDYDGTLAPVVDRPQDAVPAAGAVEVLTALAARTRVLALVTGRPAPAVVELGGLAGIPGLVVLGQYGAQRWSGGELVEDAPAPGLAAVRRELPALLGDARLEDKGLSLVVHARGLPDPAGALGALAGPVQALAGAYGLEVHPGRLVLEVRPPGPDKRAALLSLCEPPPSAVLFAGDDLGDLPAFAAVAELRNRGVAGLTVCSASDEGPAQLREQADLVVDGPAGVVELLRGLLA
ncbi:MAG TPA: trehalose-phosphatase [Mycobacteriales bacterium]|nr:trehalose-phosphatase [Mycobacteriales bacterium]